MVAAAGWLYANSEYLILWFQCVLKSSASGVYRLSFAGVQVLEVAILGDVRRTWAVV